MSTGAEIGSPLGIIRLNNKFIQKIPAGSMSRRKGRGFKWRRSIKRGGRTMPEGLRGGEGCPVPVEELCHWRYDPWLVWVFGVRNLKGSKSLAFLMSPYVSLTWIPNLKALPIVGVVRRPAQVHGVACAGDNQRGWVIPTEGFQQRTLSWGTWRESTGHRITDCHSY